MQDQEAEYYYKQCVGMGGGWDDEFFWDGYPRKQEPHKHECLRIAPFLLKTGIDEHM